MLNKNIIKEIVSLQKKKQRDKDKNFVVEGTKMVVELINSNYEVEQIFAQKDWIATNKKIIRSIITTEVTEAELKKISSQTTPQGVLAIAKQNQIQHKDINLNEGYHIALDTIQDPGNMGTIIRIADWFGIKSIICSIECADIYNSKVVQSTMGSIFRIPVIYTDLEIFIRETAHKNIPIFGTFLEGENIYKLNLPQNGIFVMGNEGNGISKKIEEHINSKVTIPCFSRNTVKPESLNVAIATSIICSELSKI